VRSAGHRTGPVIGEDLGGVWLLGYPEWRGVVGSDIGGSPGPGPIALKWKVVRLAAVGGVTSGHS
jgi:hypothetical protein